MVYELLWFYYAQDKDIRSDWQYQELFHTLQRIVSQAFKNHATTSMLLDCTLWLYNKISWYMLLTVWTTHLSICEHASKQNMSTPKWHFSNFQSSETMIKQHLQLSSSKPFQKPAPWMRISMQQKCAENLEFLYVQNKFCNFQLITWTITLFPHLGHYPER